MPLQMTNVSSSRLLLPLLLGLFSAGAALADCGGIITVRGVYLGTYTPYATGESGRIRLEISKDYFRGDQRLLKGKVRLGDRLYGPLIGSFDAIARSFRFSAVLGPRGRQTAVDVSGTFNVNGEHWAGNYLVRKHNREERGDAEADKRHRPAE